MEPSWGDLSPQPEISVVKVRGNLELLTAEQLDEVISSLTAKKRYQIIVDLQNVVYISSRGWGVFLSKIKEIRENDGDLLLSGMRPEVYEVFRVLEFDMFLKSFATLEAAAQFFGFPRPTAKELQAE